MRAEPDRDGVPGAPLPANSKNLENTNLGNGVKATFGLVWRESSVRRAVDLPLGAKMTGVIRFRKKATGAVVEPRPALPVAEELNPTAYEQRVRQQEILTELGVLALKGTPFSELLDHTARLTAEGLRAEFAKVLEYI
ncbi:MAG: hypothetical protein JOZ84_13430, partial [Methylobacteriaceae bacterium]|nr:hypothetical protein [Methylobacteriaceae bacterium]